MTARVAALATTAIAAAIAVAVAGLATPAGACSRVPTGSATVEGQVTAVGPVPTSPGAGVTIDGATVLVRSVPDAGGASTANGDEPRLAAPTVGDSITVRFAEGIHHLTVGGTYRLQITSRLGEEPDWWSSDRDHIPDRPLPIGNVENSCGPEPAAPAGATALDGGRLEPSWSYAVRRAWSWHWWALAAAPVALAITAGVAVRRRRRRRTAPG